MLLVVPGARALARRPPGLSPKNVGVVTLCISFLLVVDVCACSVLFLMLGLISALII